MVDDKAPSSDAAPWWRDVRAIMEMIALLAIALAVGLATVRGKLEISEAVLLITGALATITSAMNRRANP